MGEAERICYFWNSMQRTLATSTKKQLVVAFINEHIDEKHGILESNLKTLDFFSVPHDFEFSLNPLGSSYLLVINGTHVEHKLSNNEGVGRARKVPADLCWALWKNGILLTDVHRQTDADVVLPNDYLDTALEEKDVAATYAYTHTQGELNDQEYAHLKIYEDWLASYCEGLEYAGSPYCYWALGSTLMFKLGAYEKIRGFPNVQAGEDFHFLAKLRKQGFVRRLKAPIIEIRGRHSLRVPFGTGRALDNMSLGTKKYDPYPKEVFEKLKSVIFELVKLAEHSNLEKFFQSLDDLSVEFFKPFEKSFSNILKQGCSSEKKLKLLHESFDALATLRWVNLRLSKHEI